MAYTQLQSGGILFPDITLQTNKATADKDMPFFKGYYKNTISVAPVYTNTYPVPISDYTWTVLPINYAGTSYDTHNGLNANVGYWRYVVQLAGWYCCSVRVGINNSAYIRFANFALAVNGNRVRESGQYGSTGNYSYYLNIFGALRNYSSGFSHICYLNVNDYVQVQCYTWGPPFGEGQAGINEAFLQLHYIRS